MDLRTHVKMAALAVVVALALWAAVNNEDRITLSLEVPITYDHPSDVVRLESLDKARVTVRTSRGRGKTLTTADVTLRVDNTQGRLGRITEVLSPRQAEASFGIEVVDVQPARFAVVYDRRVTIQLPVSVSVVGEPADGYRVDLDNFRVEPARVRIEGPATELARLEAIPTDPVDVTGQSTALRVAELGLALPSGPFRLAGAELVAANVPIVPRIGSKEFENVPIVVLRGEWETTPPNPPTLRATVEGPLPSLRQLPVSAISLVIDVRDKEPQRDDYRVPVERTVDQTLCPGCSVFGLAPQREVDVNVRRARRAEPAPTEPAGTEEPAVSGEEASASPSRPTAVDGESEPDGRTG